jgi:hypothetical protein
MQTFVTRTWSRTKPWIRGAKLNKENEINRNCKFLHSCYCSQKGALCFISIESLGSDSKLKCLGLEIFQESTRLGLESLKSRLGHKKKYRLHHWWTVTTLMLEAPFMGEPLSFTPAACTDLKIALPYLTLPSSPPFPSLPSPPNVSIDCVN